jgi:hypothetical protein
VWVNSNFLVVGIPAAGIPGKTDGTGTNAGAAAVFSISGDTWTQQVELVADDAADEDGFGNAVALSGSTALIGAPYDFTQPGDYPGSAYVFVRTGGIWIQQAKLSSSDNITGEFGASVALDGDTAVVGAPGSEADGTYPGSAYVFFRKQGNWGQQAKLTSSNGLPDDEFGASVATIGERAVVGAPNHPVGSLHTGSAYIFDRIGESWSEQGILVSDKLRDRDRFGAAVAVSGDSALVGAFWHDTDSGVDAGSAYVFEKTTAGWAEQAELRASDGAPFDYFGHAVALRDDSALVGARGDDTPAGIDAGSAYLFVRDGNAWRLESKFTAGDAASGDEFGASVALSGDTALIGSWNADLPGAKDAGAAYLFSHIGNGWSQQAKLTSGLDASALDHMGSSVALDGNTALVGAFGDETAGIGAGSAYTFLIGQLPTITQQPQSRTVLRDKPVTFEVTAVGYAPLKYQWRKN